jgi:hypothetical protein
MYRISEGSDDRYLLHRLQIISTAIDYAITMSMTYRPIGLNLQRPISTNVDPYVGLYENSVPAQRKHSVSPFHRVTSNANGEFT